MSIRNWEIMSIWVWEPKSPSITGWLGLHCSAPAALKSSSRFYQVVSWLSSPHLTHTCEQTKPCRGHDAVNFDCNWRRVYCKAAFYGIPMHPPELNCQLSFLQSRVKTLVRLVRKNHFPNSRYLSAGNISLFWDRQNKHPFLFLCKSTFYLHKVH